MTKYSRESINLNCGSPGVCSATLDLSGNIQNNHVLTLELRVNLQQVPPNTKATDRLGDQWEAVAWPDGAWAAFQRKFLEAAVYWDRKCVLVPPDNENEFSYKEHWYSSPKYMPNIECRFNVKIDNNNATAHKMIRIAKIDRPDDFASDANRMIEPDVQVGKYGQVAVAHEMGHLIGQPHIGELLKTEDCQKAIKQDFANVDPDELFMFYGGKNSKVCYGWVKNADNIMGTGMQFWEVNAVSWKRALAAVLWKDADFAMKWRVVLGAYKNPRLIVNF